jgi:NAD-dependent SIR2 family protein deacetylase
MDARSRPRPRFHALLNILAGLGLIGGIVSTNVDGLEIMDSELIPEEFKTYNWVGNKWLSRDDQTFIQLHGDIGTAVCSTCHHRIDLTGDTISLLIEGKMDPCPTCSQRSRPQKHLWRPDILFYNDPREGRQQEDKDQDYAEGISGWNPTSTFSPLLL